MCSSLMAPDQNDERQLTCVAYVQDTEYTTTGCMSNRVDPDAMKAYMDCDWANEPKSTTSTSGAVILSEVCKIHAHCRPCCNYSVWSSVVHSLRRLDAVLRDGFVGYGASDGQPGSVAYLSQARSWASESVGGMCAMASRSGSWRQGAGATSGSRRSRCGHDESFPSAAELSTR